MSWVKKCCSADSSLSLGPKSSVEPISKERTPQDLSPQWDMNDQRWVVFFCWAPLGSDVFSWSIHCTTKSIWSSKQKYTVSIPTANEFLFLCIFWEAIKSLPAKKWQQNNITHHCHYYMFLRYDHSKNTSVTLSFINIPCTFRLSDRLSAFEPENFTRFTLEKTGNLHSIKPTFSNREIHLFLWEIPCFNGGISIAMS